MKKIIIFFAAALALSSCYDSYVKDYPDSAVYIAYQYDLRTFVVGEGMKFNFTVCLAGDIRNDSPRHVSVALDKALVTSDLSQFVAEGSTAQSFTAYDGMMDKAPFGYLSQSYVTNDIKTSGVTALKPLPSEYYSVDGLSDMVIEEGCHTAYVTIKANEEEILSDPDAFKPGYALGFRIEKADADYIPTDRSFSVIAVRCEHKFYGNWYHYGRTATLDGTGSVLSENYYKRNVPETNDSRIYTLTTVDGNTVVTNRCGNASGKMNLTFEGDEIIVTMADGSRNIEPYGEGSRFNGAKLLQDRKIFLNFRYDNGDGTFTAVTDTLEFRNRVRDGINEWSDEVAENYE